MTERDALVAKLREGAYNCAQCALIAFCAETGLDEDTAAKVAAGFGGGIAGSGNVCGAVSGMLMAAGMLLCVGADVTPEQKDANGRVLAKLTERFKQLHGSLLCSELKKDMTREQAKPFCKELIRSAAQILDEALAQTRGE